MAIINEKTGVDLKQNIGTGEAVGALPGFALGPHEHTPGKNKDLMVRSPPLWFNGKPIVAEGEQFRAARLLEKLDDQELRAFIKQQFEHLSFLSSLRQYFFIKQHNKESQPKGDFLYANLQANEEENTNQLYFELRGKDLYVKEVYHVDKLEKILTKELSIVEASFQGGVFHAEATYKVSKRKDRDGFDVSLKPPLQFIRLNEKLCAEILDENPQTLVISKTKLIFLNVCPRLGFILVMLMALVGLWLLATGLGAPLGAGVLVGSLKAGEAIAWGSSLLFFSLCVGGGFFWWNHKTSKEKVVYPEKLMNKNPASTSFVGSETISQRPFAPSQDPPSPSASHQMNSGLRSFFTLSSSANSATTPLPAPDWPTIKKARDACL